MSIAKLSSKIILCILTILFWGAAAGLSYIGANIFMTYERYGDTITYLHSVIPAFIILGVAFLMFLIGVIGVCGLFSENKCLLGTYFTFLMLLLALQIGGVIVLIVFRQTVNSYAKDLFDDVLKKYGTLNETRMTQNFDYVQNKLKCCGELNYTDWQHTWWYANTPDRASNIPQSCCANFVMNIENNNQLLNTESKKGRSAMTRYCTGKSPEPNPTDDYYQEGCLTKLKNLLRGRFYYIAGIILALIVIEFVGIVATCILMFCRNKNTQQPPYINIATHEDAHYNL